MNKQQKSKEERRAEAVKKYQEDIANSTNFLIQKLEKAKQTEQDFDEKEILSNRLIQLKELAERLNNGLLPDKERLAALSRLNEILPSDVLNHIRSNFVQRYSQVPEQQSDTTSPSPRKVA